VVIQQNNRKLLMMDILMSETCWAHTKWNRISSHIKLVFYSSNMPSSVCDIMTCRRILSTYMFLESSCFGIDGRLLCFHWFILKKSFDKKANLENLQCCLYRKPWEEHERKRLVQALHRGANYWLQKNYPDTQDSVMTTRSYHSF